MAKESIKPLAGIRESPFIPAPVRIPAVIEEEGAKPGKRYKARMASIKEIQGRPIKAVHLWCPDLATAQAQAAEMNHFDLVQSTPNPSGGKNPEVLPKSEKPGAKVDPKKGFDGLQIEASKAGNLKTSYIRGSVTEIRKAGKQHRVIAELNAGKLNPSDAKTLSLVLASVRASIHGKTESQMQAVLNGIEESYAFAGMSAMARRIYGGDVEVTTISLGVPLMVNGSRV
jgi:hypothetical protein